MQCHCLRGQGFKIEPPASAASTFVFLTIFGRTDLRISLSKAKFDPEADFDVRFAVARQNPRQISKTLKTSSEISAEKNFWRRKIKRPKSFETRSGKVSCRSEPSLTGKRPLAYIQMVRHDVNFGMDFLPFVFFF